MGGHSRRVAVESVNTRQARTQQQSYLTSLLQRLRFYLLQLPPDFHRATAAFDWLCDLEISTVRDAARRTTPCYRKRTDMALRASYTPPWWGGLAAVQFDTIFSPVIYLSAVCGATTHNYQALLIIGTAVLVYAEGSWRQSCLLEDCSPVNILQHGASVDGMYINVMGILRYFTISHHESPR